jgi:hypothetical protein
MIRLNIKHTLKRMFLNLLKTAGVMAFVDMFYILTGGIFARHMIERIQARPLDVKYIGAVPVYIAMAYMLLQTTSYTQAGLYGLCIFTVYTMTCYSLFSGYDIRIAIGDIIWGPILFMFSRYLLKNVV